MREARTDERIPFRLNVDLFRQADHSPQHCHTRDICFHGLFAVGAHDLRCDQPVRLAIGGQSQDRLHLDGRVVRCCSDGVGCIFVGNSPASLEVLQTLLTPKWDGENLLDGVLQMAPWFQGDNLAGWLRLTSLATDWQRLTQKGSELN